jgi:uncharacterized protein YqgC (DUF456 family)
MEQLDAAAELLDDPMPMLYTLRDQPLTLQHGCPLNHHWHVTIFGEARLLDWQEISAGPGITDLVHLVEQFNWLATGDVQFTPRPTEIISEETLVDSYILQMAAELGPLCDTRAIRQSLAAARCFHLLSYWLPRLADWFISAQRQGHTLTHLNDADLITAHLASLVALKPQLQATAQRFFAAAKMLAQSIGISLAIVFILIGIIGAFVPVLPGSLLVWFTILIYAIVEGWDAITPLIFIIITIIAAITGSANIWLSLLGAKTGGASGQSLVLGIIGSLIGLVVFSLIGSIVGYALGIILGEYLKHKDWNLALKASFGGLAGWGLSTAIKAGGSIIILILFLWRVLVEL